MTEGPDSLPPSEEWCPPPGEDAPREDAGALDDADALDWAALDWAEYFDPDSGYPDGADTWLADLAAPAADEYLEQQAAAAGVGTPEAFGVGTPEAFGVGFTHRGPGAGASGGRGFASGGPLDLLEPGPVLAVFLHQVRAAGMPGLTEDEVVGVMCAARRQSSFDASVELDAISDLDRRRTATAEATGDHRGLEHVGDEVAAALTLTGRAAARLMDLAAGTARLPAVRTALAAGRIDILRAGVFADELAGLDDVTAAAVAAVVIRDAENLTTGQLRLVLRRTVLGIDPAAARKRRERAQKDARVETWSELAGTAALAGRDLPPAEVLAADKQLTADASALKAAGADGSLQYLRARVYLARLAGQPLHTLLPGPPDPDGAGGPGGFGGPGGGDGPGGGGPGSSPGTPAGGGLFPAGLKGSVNLTAPLATFLGWNGQPGDVAGYGPLDAAATRDLAAALARTDGNKWCLTLTDPDGYAVAHGCSTTSPGPPPPPGPQGAGPTATPPPRPSRPSGQPSDDQQPRPEPSDGGRAGDQDPGDRAPSARPPSARPPNTGLSRDSQAGEPPGTGPPTRTPDPDPDPDPDPLQASPPGGRAGAWLAAIDLQPLATGDCTHQRETAGYRPSPALRHLIQIRDITCTYKTCRRPATQCDLDHAVPYDQGGRTCECNLGTPCRRHHKAKQAPGWKLEQPQPGIFTWTTPSGRTYPTRPGKYPI
jgi:hypothetical protein